MRRPTPVLITLAALALAAPATAATISGSGTAETLNGGPGNDSISAGAGSDVVNAGPGTDAVNGGPGNDTVNGGPGPDTVNGGPGNDTVNGGPGPDTVNGGPGNDTVNGGPGPDTVNGGPGNDTVNGGPGADQLSGGPGADIITCGPGTDTVRADASDTLLGCLGDTVIQAPAYSRSSPMPVRLQWNANDGYCGETAFIAAGMTFGQYTSQWTARQLANGNPSVDQTRPSSQLLLSWPAQGSTWQQAATAMRLNAEGFDPTQYEDQSDQYAGVFLSWVKNRFLTGSRVIIGMFNNTGLLEESGSGQPEYDHIVPVMGIGSAQPLVPDDDPGNPQDYRQKYYGTDQLTIGDNGLFGPFAPPAPNWGAGNTVTNPQGSTLYTATFDGVQKSRAQANAEGAACPFPGSNITNACAPWVYSIYDNATNLGNYAVAISGIADDTPGGPVALPVSLASSVNNEGQQPGDANGKMRSAPAGLPMSLTATVSGLQPGQAYNVYLYTDFASVPTGSFNANAAQATQSWKVTATGPTWTRTLSVTRALSTASSQRCTKAATTLPGGRPGGPYAVNTACTYAFRAVPAGAP